MIHFASSVKKMTWRKEHGSNNNWQYCVAKKWVFLSHWGNTQLLKICVRFSAPKKCTLGRKMIFFLLRAIIATFSYFVSDRRRKQEKTEQRFISKRNERWNIVLCAIINTHTHKYINILRMIYIYFYFSFVEFTWF